MNAYDIEISATRKTKSYTAIRLKVGNGILPITLQDPHYIRVVMTKIEDALRSVGDN